MASIEIVWTDDAKTELRDILDYWDFRNNSVTYSMKLLVDIDEVLTKISRYPLLGKSSEVEDVRFITLGHYSLIYHISTTLIHVLSVWDDRRNPTSRPV